MCSKEGGIYYEKYDVFNFLFFTEGYKMSFVRMNNEFGQGKCDVGIDSSQELLDYLKVKNVANDFVF